MNGGAAQVVYDGDGNRVAKSANGVVTRYLLDDLNPTGLPQVMDELNGSGVVTRTYTYGLQRISEDQVVNSAWTPSFYSYDGGGSVRQLTNAAGAVTDSYEYDAFGNQISHTGTTPNSYLYRGEYFDSDLGLYYLRARWMNPLTGRFMGRDPQQECNCSMVAKTKMHHPYLYASADPVDRVDPNGRMDTVDYGLILQKVVLATTASLVAYRAAVVCLYGWDATKFYSWSMAGVYGGQADQVGPCLWLWRRLPHIPTYGDQPAPFVPEDVITAPGSPWKCDSEDECEAPCPPGSKRDHQKLHFDPGTWGEPPHWDWTDCDGDTWKIYFDGTMGPG